MGLRDEIVPPFTEAVAVVFREMAEAETYPTDRSDGPPVALSAILRLRPDAGPEGRLVLALPAATAREVARRVLREIGGEPDATMIRDCAGEVANVIAGQAKTLLLGTPRHFTFSIPTVLEGDSAPDPGPSAESLAIAFESDAGPFSLQLDFGA